MKNVYDNGDNAIDKCKFHYSDYFIDINNVDIDKMFIYNEVSFSKKSL